MSEDVKKVGELDEAQQAKHADITSRLENLMATNRARIAAIVEEHRKEIALLETETEAFWQEVYASSPTLGALPDRLFIARDGKTIQSGFPHSGIPFAMFDKTEQEVKEANASDEEPVAAVPVEQRSEVRIRDFMNTLFSESN